MNRRKDENQPHDREWFQSHADQFRSNGCGFDLLDHPLDNKLMATASKPRFWRRRNNLLRFKSRQDNLDRLHTLV